LKQYEELRQVAKKEILIATAPMLPSASLSGNIYGIASNIGSMQPTYLLSFTASWNFDGLGTTGATNIQAARWQARQSLLEANEKFTDVFQQVHNAYVDTFTSESAINESTIAVASAEAELELARLRLNAGLGTNLEVLTAQRDLTEARINKAEAIISFNNSQVQLVHDIGMASVINFTAGKMITAPKSR
jgi:outer membrane protein TolC